VFVLLPSLLLFWQSTFEVSRIEIEGLQRFERAAIVSAIGVKVGATAGKTDFDAACRRLVETGLFQGCNWKYDPVSRTAVALTFSLEEAPADQTVRLTIPGVDEKELWEWLRTNEPLVQPKMPGSDAATTFYTQAIQRFLKKEVVSSVDTNLNSRETTLVFRPSNLPKVESVRFEGAQAIPPATLEKVLTPIARGTAFTEYDVQQLLNLNIRPMYENLGRLNVKFPSIKAVGGVVTIQVEEGQVYKIGAVKVTGAPEIQLPVGQTAEWNRVVDALEKATAELRNGGYLQARYNVDRSLQNDIVDLAIAFKPGPLITFNALRLEGLNVPQEANIRKLWKLPVGAPMNESYISDFLKSAFGKLGSEYNGVAQQFEPAGPTAVDVVITFRR
jgi:outer membrane protein assembly factor BamA